MPILTDATYVDKAEKVIKQLDKNRSGKFELTTTKIRKLLALTSQLFDASKVKPFEELSDKIAYLRVQYVYQAGREKAVKNLVQKSQILEALAEIQDRKSLQCFCRYMEALVAFFKYQGGE